MTMKNYLYGILATALLAFTACTKEELSAPEPAPGPDVPAEYQSGEVLVKFAPYVSDILDRAGITRSGGPATRSGILSVDEILDIVGGYEIERVFPVDPRNEERTRESELHLWYVVRFGEEFTAAEVAEKLSALGEVQHVSFNRTIHRAYNAGKKAMPLSRKTLEAIQHQRATRTGEASAYPFDDLLLPQQWHLVNRGNMFGGKSIVDADVQCEQAWELSTGDESIVVAVLDEGVMIEHPDLKNNMWVNENEIYRSHEDNDGNGYQGDVYGYNFVKNTGVISWDDVNDTGHGTHVAGVIAAQNDNGIGISSIAGGRGSIPGAKIMSCQIFSGGKGGTISTSVRAIKYAADNGASIIQCSWGYPTQSPFTSDSFYERNYAAEKEAIDYFVSKKNNDVLDGGLAIFAAGNDATNFASYPGGYRSYVSVTSFGPDYLPAYYTNYGSGCNVAAPGGDASISPAGTSAAQVLSTLPSELPAELGTDGADYGYMQGTSMACPHVSGVAALGLSYALAKGRHYTVDEFKSMLLTAVNDIDSYIIGGTKNGMVLRNYRKNMGTGSIDAYQLLMQIEGTPCLPAKVGVQQVLSLDKFFGQASANLTYKSAEMSQADMDKLGITAAPAFSYGKLQIKCTKPGVAKIKIKAMAGSSSANGEMSGMEITKEFAIIARAVQAGNGGWL